MGDISRGSGEVLGRLLAALPTPRRRTAIYLVLLGLLAGRAMYRDLGERPLRSDEVIYAGVVEQMRATGVWLYPRCADGTPHFEKPPLYSWLTLATYDLCGDGRFRYRVWSATFGIGCVLLTALLGARLFGPECGGLAGLLLLKNDLFLRDHGARMACFDTAITFFALCCFLAYWAAGRRRGLRAAWLGIGAAAAAICMFKPLFGLPFLALPGGYHLLSGGLRPDIRRLAGPAVAVAACLALALPWYLAQWLRYGDAYADAILWGNYVGRTRGAIPEHLQPWTFYLASISGSSAAFGLFVPALLWSAASGIRGRRRNAFRYVAFLAGAYVAVFSLAGCKLHWYVFPAYPLIAVMVASGPALVGGYLLRRSARGRQTDERSAVLLADEPRILRLPRPEAGNDAATRRAA